MANVNSILTQTQTDFNQAISNNIINLKVNGLNNHSKLLDIQQISVVLSNTVQTSTVWSRGTAHQNSIKRT